MSIEINSIGTNKYAPEGAESINLYTNGEGRNLTIGQLIISVSLRAAAAYETQSVLKMNTMNSDTVKLKTASDWMAQILTDYSNVNWSTAKSYLTGTIGIDSSSLPSDISSYANRIQAANAIKVKLDAFAQTQQQQMVDLQTLVNRRDVAYSTSANTIAALGSSMTGNAQNM